jgi:hypothetical protein
MKNSNKRGQAALEFLTTYGWAFLIIIVMIGAISYFGILNPNKFVPARCSISAEFSCNDFRIDGTTDNVSINLKQGIGKTIYFQGVSCTYSDVTPEAATGGIATLRGAALTAGGSWSPRDAIDIGCDFTPSISLAPYKGQKIRVNYVLNYTLSGNSGALKHTVEGEVFSEVQ